MSGTGGDHYETLRIERSASPADVKRAYFRLVKVHSPEDDPASFQAISEAYRVLSDPDARKAYDAEERLPPGVGEALEKAAALCETSPDEAVAIVMRVVAAHGRSPLARSAAAAICMRARRPAAAVSLFEKLAVEFPARVDYAAALGDAYLATNRFDDADRTLRRALALDPKRLGTYLSLAIVHDSHKRPDDALRVLDRGLQAGGTADIGLLPLHLRKLAVLAETPRWPEMKRVVTAIHSCVPADDPAAARHVSLQFHEMARQYYEARAFDIAEFVLDAAAEFEPAEAVRALEHVRPLAAAQREARAAKTDRRVPKWIVALLAARFGPPQSDAQFQSACSAIAAQIAARIAATDREWEDFRKRFPAAAAQAAELLGQLRDGAVRARRVGRRTGVRSVKSKQAGSLAGVGFVIVFLLVKLAVFSSTSSPPPVPFDATRSTEQFLHYQPKLTDEQLAKYFEAMTPEQQKLLTDPTKPFNFEEFQRLGRKSKPAKDKEMSAK